MIASSPSLPVFCYCRALRHNLAGPVFDIATHRLFGLPLLLVPSGLPSKTCVQTTEVLRCDDVAEVLSPVADPGGGHGAMAPNHHR